MRKIQTQVIKSEKKLKLLSESLQKGGEKEIKATIEDLRKDEPFEGAIGLLASLYDSTDNKIVAQTIENFFNDLKDTSARQEIINEMKNDLSDKTKKMIVSSCWQSGLDYSEYAQEFAELFIASELDMAIECMTVIEESIDRIERYDRQRIKEIIDQAPEALSFLADELSFLLEA